MSGMRQLYRQELISLAPDGLSGMKAEVRGSDLEPVKLYNTFVRSRNVCIGYINGRKRLDSSDGFRNIALRLVAHFLNAS